MPPNAPLELDRFLPYRLSLLSNRVSQAIAQVYQTRFGLSVTEWRVMAVLARFPGRSANEVAERTAMDKVAVSRAVASLVAAGRITRDLATDDRRRSILNLSPSGQEVVAQVAPLARGVEAALIAELTAAEVGLLDQLLDRLLAASERLPKATSPAPSELPAVREKTTARGPA